MRSLFQVVASMVLAQTAVAYGADAKSAITKIKQGAAATASDAKTKAGEVTQDAKAQAKEVKATVKETIESSTNQSDKTSTQPTDSYMSKDAIKKVAQDAKEVVESQGDKASLSGERKGLIRPESAVLPENVLRFRAVYGAGTSEKSYDESGKKIENGVKVTSNRGAAVFEYGITEKISAQLLMPYTLNGKVRVNDKTKYTNVIVRPRIEAIGGSAIDAGITQFKGLIPAAAAGALGIPAQLFALGYQNDQVAPAGGIDMSLINPQFAGVKIPEGAKIKDFVDNKLRSALLDVQVAANYDAAKEAAESDFQTGLGDIEVGAKYALSTVKEPWIDGVPFYTSVAAGVRFPTANYSDAIKDDKIPAGRGTTDLGIRLNADYDIVNGVQFQVENQSEFMLAKGKSYDLEAKKEIDLEREGVRQIGYTKLVVAPGTWLSAVEMLMLNARYNWDNDSKKKEGDTKSNYVISRSAQFGLTLDGLRMQLPVQLDYDYVMAARSRNVSAAVDAHVVTLKLFYKF